MTTGRVNIYLGDYHIDADFSDGRIVSGVIIDKHYSREGTFDSNGELHGEKCKLTRRNNERLYSEGMFVNGKLVKGKQVTIDGTYEGIYDTHGYLIEGTFVNSMSVKTGKFRGGYLVEGTIDCDGDTYTGIFDSVSFKGIIKCKNGFNACIEYTRGDLLTKCIVNYDGFIDELSPQQLLMYCCQGPQPSLTHSIYNRFFRDYKAGVLPMVTADMIRLHNVDDQIGLIQFMNNVKKAKLGGTEVPYTDRYNIFDNTFPRWRHD